MKKVFYPSLYCFLGFQPSFVVTLPHMWRVYIASQVYPLTPSYGSNWGHKISSLLLCIRGGGGGGGGDQKKQIDKIFVSLIYFVNGG